jgi:hypothetical protein
MNFHFSRRGEQIFRACRYHHDWGSAKLGQLHQLVSAGLAIIFSAVMFVTSHLFIEARSAKHLVTGGG